MIMQKAEIKDGKVVNILEIDPDNIPDWCASWPNIVGMAGIGWFYDGITFIEPPPYVPPKELQQAARAEAYAKEADPIFFKWQRGTATEQEWLDKVAEIKERFPYPTE